jgi:osmoprotectant transport system substrate-binding protein
MNRARALGLLSASVFLRGCAARAIRVGSKNFAESVVVAEIYASALESASCKVERKMLLGDAQALAQDLRLDIVDIYPEYTGTGAMLAFPNDAVHGNDSMDRLNVGYAPYHGCWLNHSQAENSQGLAVKRASNLRRLSECAKEAPHLRFAAPNEFLEKSRTDGLIGLRRRYGGFKFKRYESLAIGAQYEALKSNAADVVAVFTTDPQIAYDNLRVLEDDKHFWGSYYVAPVVRCGVPEFSLIETTLNMVSEKLSTGDLRYFNEQLYYEFRDPAIVAREFLRKTRFGSSRGKAPTTSREAQLLRSSAI